MIGYQYSTDLGMILWEIEVWEDGKWLQLYYKYGYLLQDAKWPQKEENKKHNEKLKLRMYKVQGGLVHFLP